MEEKIEEIASRVRELRKLSNVSIEDMAECLKVPVETYGCYEDGTLDIPASKLFEIGQRLGVDMNLLLTGEEPRMRIFTVTRKDEGSWSSAGNSTNTRTSPGSSYIRRSSLSL